MKRITKAILCAALALVFALASLRANVFAAELVPSGAYNNGYKDILTDYDREKLTAFWSITNPEGITNGEAVFISDYPGYLLDEIGGSSYAGTALTPLVYVHTSPNYSNGSYAFEFYSFYELSEWELLPGYEDAICTVYPDLCGDLDLSGTSIDHLGFNAWGQSMHISSIELDGCRDLRGVHVTHVDTCTSFSAFDCPIYTVDLRWCAFRSIDVQPERFDKPVSLRSFGGGSVGLRCDITESFFCAYPEDDTFLGWYENGELVSTELEYEHAGGGSLVACFGGDADGDGAVTTADALIAMRCSMDLVQDLNAELDINGSGAVDTADALLILRFAMGLI